ncbi:MAG: endonuclease I [Haliscomenobacteraceae bacterium CHB4]|nr:hypothetical protein [Saprospiraceae bacterium]MCE7924004.1 endonuclease I [Haliscomenobacteraceae bacterium CHB4]
MMPQSKVNVKLAPTARTLCRQINIRMTRFFVISLLTILIFPPLFSQNFEPVFPSLSGDELLDSVVSRYRPDVVLDYTHARDTLYASVLSVEDDSLRCIYSGYTVWLDPMQDPTQYIYLNGSSLGMNTEHAYPQSKGAADGNARSDMHHLFPARIPVNEARGDVPYADIPDALTQQWFRGTSVLFSMPAQDIDTWSEARPFQSFEPREAVKGDLARAVFYFYTMYRAQANAADPSFFESQRLALCQWQKQDPPDSAELVKTWRIATYQEGKPNPFILDCTLAYRCWCPETPTECAEVSTQMPGIELTEIRLTPNPFPGWGQLEMTAPFGGSLEFRLRSLLGQELARWQSGQVAGGFMSLPIEIPSLRAGQTALLEVRLRNEGKLAQGTIKIMAW